MSATWTVKDGSGQLLSQFAGATALEVGRRIVAQRYDAFRLHVSSSYREMFERDVGKVLAQQGWQIVKVSARAHRRARSCDLPLAA
jgi:hypothetical protein